VTVYYGLRKVISHIQWSINQTICVPIFLVTLWMICLTVWCGIMRNIFIRYAMQPKTSLASCSTPLWCGSFITCLLFRWQIKILLPTWISKLRHYFWHVMILWRQSTSFITWTQLNGLHNVFYYVWNQILINPSVPTTEEIVCRLYRVPQSEPKVVL